MCDSKISKGGKASGLWYKTQLIEEEEDKNVLQYFRGFISSNKLSMIATSINSDITFAAGEAYHNTTTTDTITLIPVSWKYFFCCSFFLLQQVFIYCEEASSALAPSLSVKGSSLLS
uniref:Uncharacterized protein n=1 Tax=Heterosigma akashiwo TaxID=2829 RepID=A0A6V1T576_HETAK